MRLSIRIGIGVLLAAATPGCVYNNRYPELWIYTTDYLERSERIGLPIFPSLGLRVDY